MSKLVGIPCGIGKSSRVLRQSLDLVWFEWLPIAGRLSFDKSIFNRSKRRMGSRLPACFWQEEILTWRTEQLSNKSLMAQFQIEVSSRQ